MKIYKPVLAGVIVAGSLGFAPTLSPAHDMHAYKGQQSVYMQPYDNRKSIEDDSSLAPDVPGVTEDDNRPNRSEADMLELEQALADSGYDPGPIDGVFDDQTRAALSDFQSDHELMVTGIVDAETGELLGIVISEPS